MEKLKEVFEKYWLILAIFEVIAIPHTILCRYRYSKQILDAIAGLTKGMYSHAAGLYYNPTQMIQ
jgi:hypothetical protein